MLTTKLAEPYASALIKIAIDTKSLDCISLDIKNLLNIFKTNNQLKNYLKNPINLKQSKKNLLNNLIKFKNLHTNHFIMLLIDRSRINLFEEIAQQYLNNVYMLINIKVINLTSAFPLDKKQEFEIVKQLKIEIVKQLKKDNNAYEIKLINTVDKTLLGGFKIQIGSNVIDLTLKKQIQQLANQFEIQLI